MPKPKLIESKQHGHRQAMTNTFLRLNTRPEEYTPHYQHASYSEVTHCDLCGAALTYSFNLIHAEDPYFEKGWSLKVGSDCIYNFCEIYFPGICDQILQALDKALITSKLGKFKHENTEIFNQSKHLKETISNLSKIYGSAFTRLNEVENFYKNHKELTRTLYLSKPKVDQIFSLAETVASSEFLTLLDEHQKMSKDKVLTKDYLKLNPKYKKFNNLYVTYSPILNYYKLSDYALSSLEQELFCQQINKTLEMARKRKSRQYLQYPQLYEYLITGSFAQYSSEWSAKKQIQRLGILTDYQINHLINSPQYLASLPKLPSMPKIWHNIFTNISEGKVYEI